VAGGIMNSRLNLLIRVLILNLCTPDKGFITPADLHQARCLLGKLCFLRVYYFFFSSLSLHVLMLMSCELIVVFLKEASEHQTQLTTAMLFSELDAESSGKVGFRSFQKLVQKR
jgi:hypothetical protein